jgi:hypothetical protein
MYSPSFARIHTQTSPYMTIDHYTQLPSPLCAQGICVGSIPRQTSTNWSVCRMLRCGVLWLSHSRPKRMQPLQPANFREILRPPHRSCVGQTTFRIGRVSFFGGRNVVAGKCCTNAAPIFLRSKEIDVKVVRQVVGVVHPNCLVRT